MGFRHVEKHAAKHLWRAYELFEDVAGRHPCIDAMRHPSEANDECLRFGVRVLRCASADELAGFREELSLSLPRYLVCEVPEPVEGLCEATICYAGDE